MKIRESRPGGAQIGGADRQSPNAAEVFRKLPRITFEGKRMDLRESDAREG